MEVNRTYAALSRQLPFIFLFLLGALLLAIKLGVEECADQLIGWVVGVPFGLLQHSMHDAHLMQQLWIDILGVLQCITNFEDGNSIKQSIWMAKVAVLAIVVLKIQFLNNTRTKQHFYQKKFQHNTDNNGRERTTNIARTSAVVTSLLLRSGDVEQNPGPGQQRFENVDDRVILKPADLKKVYGDVRQLQAKYYDLGVWLGLPSDELDHIKISCSDNALMETLKLWLQQKYDTKRHGLPTWQKLVKAIDNVYGQQLASEIAAKHPKGTEVEVRSHRVPHIQYESDPESMTTVLQPRRRRRGYERLHSEGYEVKISTLDMCRQSFAAHYLRQIDDRAWPPVKSTDFIHLALVRDHSTWRKTVSGSVDEVVSGKKTTPYREVFVDIDHLGKKFILMEGRPGSGKTTLMNKVSCDWANGEILKSKLVVYVPLRNLSVEPVHDLRTILRVACPVLKKNTENLSELVDEIERKEGAGVVFAFDGLDEYKLCCHQSTSTSGCCCFKTTTTEVTEDAVNELLHGNILTKAIIVVTSRPAACMHFREYAGKQLEVIGFLKDQITEYVREYFRHDSQKAECLLDHLKHHPNLMNMAYLPLHCTMLTVLFEEDEVLPVTETDFYKHFTLSTLLRSIRRRRGRIESKLTEFHQLPHDDKQIFYQICELAYNATIESKQVFKSTEVNKIIRPGSTGDDNTSLGLVVIDRYFMKYGLDEAYTFVHLTFQEYLAAIHISTFSDHKKALFIVEKCREFYLSQSVVWKFLCGMMDFKKSSVKNAFKTLLQYTQDPLSAVHYGYESQQPYPCASVVNHLIDDKSITIVDRSLSATDCAAFGYVVRVGFERRIKLTFEKCLFSIEGGTALISQLQRNQFSLQLWEGQSVASILCSLEETPAPGLQHLILKKNKFGDNGAKLLGKALKNCCNLQELNLWQNDITFVGAKALSDGLKLCTNLRKLNLTDNKLGDAGVNALLVGLANCQDLTALNLMENNLTDDAVTSLCKMISTFKKLKKLQITHNQFTASAIEKLQEARRRRNSLNDFSELESANFC